MILRDIRLPISEATISGHIFNPEYVKNEDPGLEWDVIVQTEEKAIYEGTDEEFFLDPRMSWAEFRFPTVRRWPELEGKSIHFDAASDDLSAPHPFSYFNTHELIPFSTLSFVKRAGNKFRIRWEGKCDLLWEEPYHKDVPFLIETEAVFKGVSVQAGRRDTDATTLALLSKYLDPADFIQRPMEEPAQDTPAENRYGVFEPFLDWLFPDRAVSRSRNLYRYSIFEPRL